MNEKEITVHTRKRSTCGFRLPFIYRYFGSTAISLSIRDSVSHEFPFLFVIFPRWSHEISGFLAFEVVFLRSTLSLRVRRRAWSFL